MKETFAPLALAVPEARIGSKFPMVVQSTNEPVGIVGDSNHGSVVMRVECYVGKPTLGLGPLVTL